MWYAAAIGSVASVSSTSSRSGERRVGKECRFRWGPDHLKKKKHLNSLRSNLILIIKPLLSYISLFHLILTSLPHLTAITLLFILLISPVTLVTLSLYPHHTQ